MTVRQKFVMPFADDAIDATDNDLETVNTPLGHIRVYAPQVDLGGNQPVEYGISMLILMLTSVMTYPCLLAKICSPLRVLIVMTE